MQNKCIVKCVQNVCTVKCIQNKCKIICYPLKFISFLSPLYHFSKWWVSTPMRVALKF